MPINDRLAKVLQAHFIQIKKLYASSASTAARNLSNYLTAMRIDMGQHFVPHDRPSLHIAYAIHDLAQRFRCINWRLLRTQIQTVQKIFVAQHFSGKHGTSPALNLCSEYDLWKVSDIKTASIAHIQPMPPIWNFASIVRLPVFVNLPPLVVREHNLAPQLALGKNIFEFVDKYARIP